ncbi:metallophosphatase domain-containing protein [Marinobacter qingdaonensis]|uniref:Metallophosphatase domain-containing protein n=1 Tax=Marinobacter qingdaonensis TaxID=3108486 RepID=A0ABU5NUM9_9GAMM|nr:metallophosphatase domain-containing protein [Marinobacter sp. ASW11-75]MEA1079504.1 metallophosphatase domain-containing protein [Marinobacter sp. ASW11-75]
MRIVCISDTHSLHDQIEGIPHGDVLIHAGDLTGSGRIPAGFEAVEWLSQLPHRHKILIAGNHDFCFEDYSAWMREHCERCEVIYLEDESTVIDGVKFHGSPWTPRFRDMAYNADPALAAEKMRLVPADTDVLITHGPPRGVMDYVPEDDLHVGCLSVEARIPFLKSLKAHVFGHIHEGYGILEKGGVVYVNASTCTERYKPTNPPIVIDI